MSHLRPLLNSKLRTRPGMYIGEASLSKLAAFLRGYDYAHYELRGDRDDPFFLSFQEWIVQRLKTPNYFGWERAILQQCSSEAEAFDRFWELFDEYSAQVENKMAPAEPRANGPITSNIAEKQEFRP